MMGDFTHGLYRDTAWLLRYPYLICLLLKVLLVCKLSLPLGRDGRACWGFESSTWVVHTKTLKRLPQHSSGRLGQLLLPRIIINSNQSFN